MVGKSSKMYAANLQQVYKENPQGQPFSCWVLLLYHVSGTKKECHVRSIHQQIDSILVNQNINYSEITTYQGKRFVYFRASGKPFALII